jgi:hypothetical protein
MQYNFVHGTGASQLQHAILKKISYHVLLIQDMLKSMESILLRVTVLWAGTTAKKISSLWFSV